MGLNFKKTAAIGVSTVLGLAALAGCAAASGPGASDAKNAVDPKALATLPKAESGKYKTLVATMPYKAGDGYWDYDISDITVLQMTKMEGTDYTDEDVAAGKEMADVFNFSPRKAGSAKITMRLDKDGTKQKECIYEVTVDNDLNATIDGYSGDEGYDACLMGLHN